MAKRKPYQATTETNTTEVEATQVGTTEDAQTQTFPEEVPELLQTPEPMQVEEITAPHEVYENAPEPVVSIEDGVQVTNLSVDTTHMEANYLNLPKEIRDAQVEREVYDIPTNTQMRPPMNPFMLMEEQRRKTQVVSQVPEAEAMSDIIRKEGFAIDTVFALSSLQATLSNYVTEMAPNTPKEPSAGSRYQSALASALFTALSAEPDVSLESLRLIELYFKTYNNHALSRTHVFRFMDVVRLDANHLRAFQSLLHLFVELGSPDGRTRTEVAREVNLAQIADSLVENNDAQARLVEFMAS